MQLIWTPTWSLKKGDAINISQNWSDLTVKSGFSCVCWTGVLSTNYEFSGRKSKQTNTFGKSLEKPFKSSNFSLRVFLSPETAQLYYGSQYNGNSHCCEWHSRIVSFCQVQGERKPFGYIRGWRESKVIPFSFVFVNLAMCILHSRGNGQD